MPSNSRKKAACASSWRWTGCGRNLSSRVEVRDTGVGVPLEKRQDIFQEFVQADSRHARTFGGSGLGLAISKRLVETMGGEIGMTSGSGTGSTFWFTLPALVVKPPPAEAAPLKGRCIAIVGHNKVLKEGLRLQIEALGGEVACAFRPRIARAIGCRADR